MSNIDLTRAGSSISLDVFADKEKIGTVELGRGSIRWYGKNKQKGTTISCSGVALMLDISPRIC